MIFCVEDDNNIRDLLVYTLETTGFHARGLEDSQELWKALAEEEPELILLDIMLPGEDGYSILEKLKKSSGTRDIPIIMVTAKEAEFDKRPCPGSRCRRLYYQALWNDGIYSQGEGCAQAQQPSRR